MLILVPVDGSAAAELALAHALWLVHGRPEAAIALLNVQTRDMIGLSDIDVQTKAERAMACRNFARAMRGAIKVCNNAGVRFQVRTEIGPICETIDRVAREVRADQIVMGTRGLGRLSSLLLGSIAIGVIHMVRIPVTLVKSGSDARGVIDIALDRSTLHPS